jgi:polysaccharide export outer membrane protein
MVERKLRRSLSSVTGELVAIVAFSLTVAATAQQAQVGRVRPSDYIVGPRDVLAITVWNQVSLSGKFNVDADGTFTFPLVGKVQAGGLTLRDVETQLKKLLGNGYFIDPELSVAVEEYRSQRIFIVGEVRDSGSYPMTGQMTLIEALAKAKSTTPEAAKEVVIVRPASQTAAVSGPVMPDQVKDADVIHVDLRALQNGDLSKNVLLRDGDTIFVPRAESVFIYGQVRSPGVYNITRDMTVVQLLALAGGVTDRGAPNRLRISRLVDGQKKEIKAKLNDLVKAGDTIIVPERFF